MSRKKEKISTDGIPIPDFFLPSIANLDILTESGNKFQETSIEISKVGKITEKITAMLEYDNDSTSHLRAITSANKEKMKSATKNTVVDTIKDLERSTRTLYENRYLVKPEDLVKYDMNLRKTYQLYIPNLSRNIERMISSKGDPINPQINDFMYNMSTMTDTSKLTGFLKSVSDGTQFVFGLVTGPVVVMGQSLIMNAVITTVTGYLTNGLITSIPPDVLGLLVGSTILITTGAAKHGLKTMNDPNTVPSDITYRKYLASGVQYMLIHTLTVIPPEFTAPLTGLIHSGAVGMCETLSLGGSGYMFSYMSGLVRNTFPLMVSTTFTLFIDSNKKLSDIETVFNVSEDTFDFKNIVDIIQTERSSGDFERKVRIAQGCNKITTGFKYTVHNMMKAIKDGDTFVFKILTEFPESVIGKLFHNLTILPYGYAYIQSCFRPFQPKRPEIMSSAYADITPGTTDVNNTIENVSRHGFITNIFLSILGGPIFRLWTITKSHVVTIGAAAIWAGMLFLGTETIFTHGRIGELAVHFLDNIIQSVSTIITDPSFYKQMLSTGFLIPQVAPVAAAHFQRNLDTYSIFFIGSFAASYPEVSSRLLKLPYAKDLHGMLGLVGMTLLSLLVIQIPKVYYQITVKDSRSYYNQAKLRWFENEVQKMNDEINKIDQDLQNPMSAQTRDKLLKQKGQIIKDIEIKTALYSNDDAKLSHLLDGDNMWIYIYTNWYKAGTLFSFIALENPPYETIAMCKETVGKCMSTTFDKLLPSVREAMTVYEIKKGDTKLFHLGIDDLTQFFLVDNLARIKLNSLSSELASFAVDEAVELGISCQNMIPPNVDWNLDWQTARNEGWESEVKLSKAEFDDLLGKANSELVVFEQVMNAKEIELSNAQIAYNKETDSVRKELAATVLQNVTREYNDVKSNIQAINAYKDYFQKTLDTNIAINESTNLDQIKFEPFPDQNRAMVFANSIFRDVQFWWRDPNSKTTVSNLLKSYGRIIRSDRKNSDVLREINDRRTVIETLIKDELALKKSFVGMSSESEIERRTRYQQAVQSYVDDKRAEYKSNNWIRSVTPKMEADWKAEAENRYNNDPRVGSLPRLIAQKNTDIETHMDNLKTFVTSTGLEYNMLSVKLATMAAENILANNVDLTYAERKSFDNQVKWGLGKYERVVQVNALLKDVSVQKRKNDLEVNELELSKLYDQIKITTDSVQLEQLKELQLQAADNMFKNQYALYSENPSAFFLHANSLRLVLNTLGPSKTYSYMKWYPDFLNTCYDTLKTSQSYLGGWTGLGISAAYSTGAGPLGGLDMSIWSGINIAIVTFSGLTADIFKAVWLPSVSTAVEAILVGVYDQNIFPFWVPIPNKANLFALAESSKDKIVGYVLSTMSMSAKAALLRPALLKNKIASDQEIIENQKRIIEKAIREGNTAAHLNGLFEILEKAAAVSETNKQKLTQMQTQATVFITEAIQNVQETTDNPEVKAILSDGPQTQELLATETMTTMETMVETMTSTDIDMLNAFATAYDRPDIEDLGFLEPESNSNSKPMSEVADDPSTWIGTKRFTSSYLGVNIAKDTDKLKILIPDKVREIWKSTISEISGKTFDATIKEREYADLTKNLTWLSFVDNAATELRKEKVDLNMLMAMMRKTQFKRTFDVRQISDEPQVVSMEEQAATKWYDDNNSNTYVQQQYITADKSSQLDLQNQYTSFGKGDAIRVSNHIWLNILNYNRVEKFDNVDDAYSAGLENLDIRWDNPYILDLFSEKRVGIDQAHYNSVASEYKRYYDEGNSESIAASIRVMRNLDSDLSELQTQHRTAINSLYGDDSENSKILLEKFSNLEQTIMTGVLGVFAPALENDIQMKKFANRNLLSESFQLNKFPWVSDVAYDSSKITRLIMSDDIPEWKNVALDNYADVRVRQGISATSATILKASKSVALHSGFPGAAVAGSITAGVVYGLGVLSVQTGVVDSRNILSAIADVPRRDASVGVQGDLVVDPNADFSNAYKIAAEEYNTAITNNERSLQSGVAYDPEKSTPEVNLLHDSLLELENKIATNSRVIRTENKDRGVRNSLYSFFPDRVIDEGYVSAPKELFKQYLFGKDRPGDGSFNSCLLWKNINRLSPNYQQQMESLRADAESLGYLAYC